MRIVVWVLSLFLFATVATAQQAKKRTGREPLFGPKLASYPITSQELSGACFYLVCGHGGPDPGAIGTYNGHKLHEDEYAYDIVLRLGRELLMRGAKVHIIIRDSKDGIREEQILAPSKRETCMGEAIPLNQVQRLSQRCKHIDRLSKQDKGSYKRAIFVHVDSRGTGQQTDVFFYHAPNSPKGKRLATTLQTTFSKKYGTHQPNRGFRGTVSGRDLYVLRNTQVVGAFLELGNIRNKRDQQRLILPNNRQALARWVADGIAADYKKEKR
ncbi:MAG: N-acetylmuramoyl-L-alanine amidase family protein [Phocaeicola sp.]